MSANLAPPDDDVQGRGHVPPQAIPAAMVRRLGHALGLVPPEHAAALALINGILLSMSLSVAEKDHALSSLPVLSAWQLDELTKTFDEERRAFDDLADTEFEVIADLQARALWAAFTLVGSHCATTELLELAWLKRTLRRGASTEFRHRLAALPPGWWCKHVHARWAYGGMFEGCHPSRSN